MSDRKTFIVRLKISYEKHWEKISIWAMVLMCIAVLMACISIIWMLYNHYDL